MKNLLLFIPLVYFLLPVPHQAAGVYNQFTNTISCVPSVCAHEVGHMLDDLAGWGMAISSSEEWALAMEVAKPPLPMVGSYGEPTLEELYAELFEIAINKGHMAQGLSKFYDMDKGIRLLQSPLIYRRNVQLLTSTLPEARFIFYYYEHHMEEE